jgi:hypothetical protein
LAELGDELRTWPTRFSCRTPSARRRPAEHTGPRERQNKKLCILCSKRFCVTCFCMTVGGNSTPLRSCFKVTDKWT